MEAHNCCCFLFISTTLETKLHWAAVQIYLLKKKAATSCSMVNGGLSVMHRPSEGLVYTTLLNINKPLEAI